jgi:hypothetical protein
MVGGAGTQDEQGIFCCLWAEPCPPVREPLRGSLHMGAGLCCWLLLTSKFPSLAFGSGRVQGSWITCEEHLTSLGVRALAAGADLVKQVTRDREPGSWRRGAHM